MFRLAASLALASSLSVAIFAQSWQCYGGNAQHSGAFNGTSQPAALIQWQVPLDDGSSYYGGATLTHYAAPMVTPANNVVHGFRFTTGTGANANNDNWSVIGRSGVDGTQLWQMTTDFSAALLMPTDWTTVFPVTLVYTGTKSSLGVAAAALGGSIDVRPSADAETSTVTRIVFYTTLADFTNNKASYAPIKINTPLTADSTGNLYFGYEVTASLPAKLANLGTGGIAKINAITGAATYKSVESMGISSKLVRPAMNAAPALTTDGSYIYVGLTNGNGSNGFLGKLSTKDLSTSASVEIIDPAVTTQDAELINESSASPMIGPDGHVFYGVFGYQYRESHGWMVQYDANLKANDSKGARWPTGAFGWDDTAVVVPKSMVPTYKGSATYLILTKYNNYDFGPNDGGDGSNKIAILDPTSNSTSRDRQSLIPVMNEISTLLGPNLTNSDSGHPNARFEWCINSAAIDINRSSAIVNSEDGHMYRWSFLTNSVTEALNLEPPTGEAYTETAIGPNGQIYVINNATLFAIGTNYATSVSTYQGTTGKGNLTNVMYHTGTTYNVSSAFAGYGDAAGIEADFSVKAASPTTLNVSIDASAVAGVNGSILAFNYQTGDFDTLTSGPMTATLAFYTATLKSNVSNYIGPKGAVRIRLQGYLPNGGAKTKFNLATDLMTCNAQ